MATVVWVSERMKQVLTVAMARLPSSAHGRSSRNARPIRQPFWTMKTMQSPIARKSDRQKMICQSPADSSARTMSPFRELTSALAITRNSASR